MTRRTAGVILGSVRLPPATQLLQLIVHVIRVTLASLLCAVALPAEATLEVKLPTPARIYLTDSKSVLYPPPGGTVYRRGKEEHVTVAGSFAMVLPAGTYNLAVERGPEYSPYRETLTLREGERRTITPIVRHAIPMNARGWYSADLHNHRKLEEMPLLLRAEDLNFAPVLSDWVWEGRSRSEPPQGIAALMHVDARHAYTTIDKEIERLVQGPGAVDLIGLTRPIPFEGDWLFPPNSHFTRLAHQQGAYVDAEKILWRDVPALVAQGEVDFAGVVHNHFNRHGVLLETDRWGMAPKDREEFRTPEGMALWTLDVYYHFLNCGFRLPVSGGTASGVMAAPIGYNRVYAQLRGAFSTGGLLRAMKAGRSFATNGPMVFFTVNGQGPGATLQLDAPRKLTVRVETLSTGSLDRIEIVRNGEVVTYEAIGGSHSRYAISDEIDMPRSGWIAARVFERPGASPKFAQSSPVYVSVAGKPGETAGSARYFVHWLEREIAFYQAEQRFRSAAEKEAMLRFLRDGLDVYRKLAGASN